MNITKIYLLVNQHSGSYIGDQNFKLIEDYLTQHQQNFETSLSDRPESIINLARIASNKITDLDHEILLVVGGDGTLNQAVNGVKLSNHPDAIIGFIPSGTGNDFSRALKIDLDPLTALQKILTDNQVSTVDLGKMRDLNRQKTTYFVNNVGIGFDAMVVALTNNSKLRAFLNKIKLGNLAYSFHLLQALFKQSTFEVSVHSDYRQQNFKNVFLATTTNHPYFGGGVPILPRANVYNNKIDTVIVERPNTLKLIYLFFKLFKDGSHVNSEYFHVFESDKVKISSKTLQYGQVDGEELGSRSYELEFTVAKFNLIH